MPGALRRPSDEEMLEAVAIAQRRVDTVTFSHITSEQACAASMTARTIGRLYNLG